MYIYEIPSSPSLSPLPLLSPFPVVMFAAGTVAVRKDHNLYHTIYPDWNSYLPHHGEIWEGSRNTEIVLYCLVVLVQLKISTP